MSMAIEKNYEGEVDEGNLPSGFGVMKYIISDICHAKYDGQWRSGKKDGGGVQTSKCTGVKFVGIWRNGEPQNGVFHFQDGTKKLGHWEGGVPILD